MPPRTKVQPIALPALPPRPSRQWEYTTSLWVDGRWFPDFDLLGMQGWEGWSVVGMVAYFKREKR